jgi:hypothetical protein
MKAVLFEKFSTATKKLSKRDVIRLGRECGVSAYTALNLYENFTVLGKDDLRDRGEGPSTVFPRYTFVSAAQMKAEGRYVAYRDLTPAKAAGILARRYDPSTRKQQLPEFLDSENISLGTFQKMLREITIKGTLIGERVYPTNCLRLQARDLLRSHKNSIRNGEAELWYLIKVKLTPKTLAQAQIALGHIVYENLRKLAEVAR